jgi:hypothetical protein
MSPDTNLRLFYPSPPVAHSAGSYINSKGGIINTGYSFIRYKAIAQNIKLSGSTSIRLGTINKGTKRKWDMWVE